MVSDLSTRAADDKQSEIDLRMAALRAQEAVAADPASENAAIDLFEAVGRSARAATAISGGARKPPPNVARAA